MQMTQANGKINRAMRRVEGLMATLVRRTTERDPVTATTIAKSTVSSHSYNMPLIDLDGMKSSHSQ